MKKIMNFILTVVFLFSHMAYAQFAAIDIYGVEEPVKQKIYKGCYTLLEQYFLLASKLNMYSSEQELLELKKIEKQIYEKVKKIDDVLIAKPSVIHYPREDKRYLTLDIVERKDNFRLPKQRRPINKFKLIPMPKDVSLLFELWRSYDKANLKLLQKGRLNPANKSCPVMHCTWGFDQIELKTVLPVLQRSLVVHHRALLDIIQNSQNDIQRADAIFIVANSSSYEEIANFLLAFIDDPSEHVRNNTMRVLGAIALKHRIKNLMLTPIIKALDYPYVTDRNKAAFVLFGIVKNSPETHRYVIKNATRILLKLLRLEQPNNHDFAYHILQLISHKNYDARDYEKWENWAALAQKRF